MTTTGITVPGTAGGNIVVSTGTGDYLKLAQQMASALTSASVGSGLSVSTVTAGSFVPTAPSVKGSTELGIVGAGGVATHAEGTGWNYVVNVTSSPDTVVAANANVLSGDQGATLNVSGTSTVAATGGNNLVNATGNYLVSTSTGNDTIYGSGSGTIAAGAGANFVSVSGSAGGGNFVISAGTGDTIRGIGPVSVNAIGANGSITGSSNAADTATVTLGGSANTFFANQTQASVTISSGASAAGAGNLVLGGASPGGTLSVVDLGDFAVISGGADDVLSATVSGNNVQVNGGSGALFVDASGANDTVAAGAAASTVSLAGSSAFLFGNTTGGGTLTAVVNSNLSTTTTRAENSSITLGGANSTINAGSGTLNLSVSGSNNIVFAGSGGETISTSSNPLVFAPATGGLNFIGGAGTPTIVGGKAGGSISATVGSGGISFSSGATNSTILGGTGQATIFGGDGAVVNFIGTATGGAQFHAYEGNETLLGSGSTTNNSFYGSSIAGATADLVGGTGNDQFFVGANSETLIGGGGSDTFVFLNQTTKLGASHITITDFNATDDTVFMVGYSSANGGLSNVFANATGPAITSGGTGLTLTLSDNTTVTFSNLTSVTQLNGKIGYF